MVVRWQDLVRYFGTQIDNHRAELERAHRQTYALLVSGNAASSVLLSSHRGEHAEARVLQSRVWRQDIQDAIGSWTPPDDQFMTALVINRSPCIHCTTALCSALGRLHKAYPLRADRNPFWLVSLGAYEDKAMETRTGARDLRRLIRAGWTLCGLDMGHGLTRRGAILEEGIVNAYRMVGERV